ncbi:uncharacterized protein LOC116296188 isoform X2 [Actinia tenebrosa]|uniref:Uncharacterized protein LOC116296188 isoform X2 n=1 Tax=Actinia tenebrosa TaxID=6105 RepID=A0A6P8HUE7_ACTTE|nr:uncharacterized protein LOC116296188 isoform X2 [Actinia tenebrosa]
MKGACWFWAGSECQAYLKMNQCRIANCPTDPNAHQFVKTFRELQGKKEHFYVQLHNEVIQWRLMFQRGVSNKFENNDKVNKLIGEFITIHEKLDDFLEEERKNIEQILPKRKALKDVSDGQKKSKKDSLIQGERESLELTPEAMQRLMCFQQCNDQHIRILTQVLSDIEDCKKFESAKTKQETKEVQPAPSNKPVSITVSSVDSEEFGIQSESHS